MNDPVAEAGDRTAPAASRRGGWLGYLAAAALIILLAAWAVWTALARAPAVDSQLLYSTVHSDSAVTVHVEVAKDVAQPATCTVRVLDTRGRLVGQAKLTVPAQAERVRTSERVRTTARTAATHVDGCHLTTRE